LQIGRKKAMEASGFILRDYSMPPRPSATSIQVEQRWSSTTRGARSASGYARALAVTPTDVNRVTRSAVRPLARRG
jgi:hypothetical protein